MGGVCQRRDRVDRVVPRWLGEAARSVWGRLPRWLQTLLAFVAAIVGFVGVLSILLRHNEPPRGEYAYGVIIGLLYAMLAFGLILIYRATRIINFAQAEIGAASAVLAVLLMKTHHVPYMLGFVIAIGTGVISGMVIEVLVVRRFAKTSRLVLSVATIGVGLIFAGLQFYMPLWIGGKLIANTAPPRTPFSGLHLFISPERFDGNSLVIVFAVVIVLVGLTAFFKLTDVGIAVRGSAENADRAALLGIPVKRVSTIVWVLAAALSSLSLFLRIPVVGMPIGVFVGPTVLLYGLAAAVIARMERFGVALVAGIMLGVLEQCLYYFSKDPSVSGALILPVLLVAMLLQRGKLSRGQDTGVNTWSLAREFRPIPPELRRLPEVVWARYGLGVLALALLVGGFEFITLKQQILASVVVIYGIVVVSLVILTGWAGQISLGQWAFAGIGAAVAGNMAGRHHGDFFLTLVVAGLVGAVSAVIVGLPALRIPGLYLAMTTLAFAITVQLYFLSRHYFAGFLPTQSQVIERPYLYGRYSLAGDRAFYYTCLAVLALCLLSVRALRRSRTGRVIIAVRDNQKGAQAYGIAAAKAKLWAFAFSGFWAAVAGALFAYHEGALDNAAFNPEFSLTLLIVLVIGGVTSLPGAILGTIYIGILKYGDLSSGAQLLATGIGALVLLYIFPGGLAQIFYGLRDGVLRVVAARKGIVVPSLLADVRVAGRDAQRDVLADAGAAVERPRLDRTPEAVGAPDGVEA
ncbi:MAG: branched-chain amino acid ABC transporter permease [Acidimicrobiales bacterium]